MSTDRAPHVVVLGGPPSGAGAPPDPGEVVIRHAKTAAGQLVTAGLLAEADVGEAVLTLVAYGLEMWQDGWTESRGEHNVRSVWLLPSAAAARAFATFAAEQADGRAQVHPAGDPLDRLLDHAAHCTGREIR